MDIELRPIGIIHTPFTDPVGMPIQPTGGEGVAGTIDILPEYRDGLADLGGFSHVILLYHLHRSRGYALRVVPFMDTVERGVFATRAPKRPNPIGLSLVRLERVENGVLHILDVDMLDGTPLLDIKPYIPQIDSRSNARAGWLEELQDQFPERRSDPRFR
jgi:tRNA (adenine37-N6)-methyltransferase